MGEFSQAEYHAMRGDQDAPTMATPEIDQDKGTVATLLPTVELVESGEPQTSN